MNKVDELFEKANSLKGEGEKIKSVELYQRIIREFPESDKATYAQSNLDLMKEVLHPYYKYKNFWRRVFAQLLDGLLLGLLWVVLVGLFLFSGFMTIDPMMPFHLTSVFGLMAFSYSIFFHGKFGQTVGKMVCDIKVIDVSEKRALGFKQAFLRDIVPLVSTVLSGLLISLATYDAISIEDMAQRIESSPLLKICRFFNGYISWWFILEIVTMLTNSRRRAIHDFIARSVVVKTK